MIRHFKIWVLILGFILAALVIGFAGSLFLGSCSYQNNCMNGGRSSFIHTPISTLVQVTLQDNGVPFSSVVQFGEMYGERRGITIGLGFGWLSGDATISSLQTPIMLPVRRHLLMCNLVFRSNLMVSGRPGLYCLP